MKPDRSEGSKKPKQQIFYDPTRHRLVFVVLLTAVFGVASAVWAVAFTYGLYRSKLQSSEATVASPLQRREVLDADIAIEPHDEPAAVLSFVEPEMRDADGSVGRLIGPAWTMPEADVYAYVPVSSPAAFRSAEAHISLIDVLMPEWHAIDVERGVLTKLGDTKDADFRQFIVVNRESLKLMPVVRPAFAPHDRILDILDTANARRTLVASAVQTVLRENYDGLCFDFAGAESAAIDGMTQFLTDLKDRLATVGRESCVIAAMQDPLWLQDGVSTLADRFVVLGFAEPGPYSPPAPLAPQSEFERRIVDIVGNLAPAVIAVGIGSFGYDWKSGTTQPDRIGYFDVTGESDLSGGNIGLEPASLNTRLVYNDNDGARHDAWLLDAISAHNQMLRVPFDDVSGIAIWPLGLEDPGLWDLLDPLWSGYASASALLRNVPPTRQVRYVGTGPVVDIATFVGEGTRELTLDHHSGLITGVGYLRVPTATTVERRGSLRRNEVILSFDDGPDPRFTPQILDILQEYEVPAVFFVVGAKVLANDDIVRRMINEQHEIGVHTFFHPSLEKISDLRLTLELHAAQELIAGLAGRNTMLFRSPYGTHYDDLTTVEQARILKVLSQEGYVEVIGEIESKDWTRPGADVIAGKVIREVENGDGHVILMHDGGGDRSQTVAALKVIIETLLEKGYRFTTVASLLGEENSAGTGAPENGLGLFGQYSFEGIRMLGAVLTGLFFTTILAGLLRSLTIIVLALIRTRRPQPSGEFRDPVTVAIPAFCEESVIARSIGCVLASDHPVLEIIVIDDGSTDNTSGVVDALFGSEPKVRFVRQANMGKAEALNHAFRLAQAPIVVAIDADTIIAPDAIGALVRPFADPGVGAVAGNVKVGNRNNLLTRLQALEYITSQNLDRRAYDTINGIMVVPGSIGAWRKEAVEAAGGYSTETLVEDADITVSIIRAGYRVVYEPEARAFTEAPETVPQWIRQRLRWSFGMMQMSWKHKAAFFERRAVGLVSIPDLVVFGVLFSLVAPIADLVFILNLVGITAALVGSSEWAVNPTAIAITVAYVAYFLSDLLLAILAMSLEPDEDRRLLPWVLTQRFFYRQIYWFVSLRSVGRVLAGSLAGWGKVTRTASVSSDEALNMARASRRIVDTAREPSPDRKSLSI